MRAIFSLPHWAERRWGIGRIPEAGDSTVYVAGRCEGVKEQVRRIRLFSVPFRRPKADSTNRYNVAQLQLHTAIDSVTQLRCNIQLFVVQITAFETYSFEA
jgi:hypothetical protein